MTKYTTKRIFKKFKALSKKELKKQLLKLNVATDSINNVIKELEENGIIYFDINKNVYIPLPSNFFISEIYLDDVNDLFVHYKNKKYNVNASAIKVLPGDVVICEDDNAITIKKIISRRNTKVLVKVSIFENEIRTTNVNISKDYPLLIPFNITKKLSDGDVISVSLPTVTTNGYYIAKMKDVLYNENTNDNYTDDINTKIVCEVILENGQKKLVPIFKKIDNYNINIDTYEINKYVQGDRLLISNNTIEKYICNIKDNDATTTCLCESFGFPTKFSKEAINELKKENSEISSEEFSSRKDYTNDLFVTIDGASTKDRDDAVCVTKNSDNTYTLKVAISDVSHYVKQNTALFHEAISMRATSVYTAGSVNPMLPHKLSSDICSLDEQIPKLVKTIEITFDLNGKVLNREFNYGVIKSKKAMTYEAVNDYIENKNVQSGYENFTNEIDKYLELTNILIECSKNRGFLKFNNSELDIVVDENKKTTQIKSYETAMAQQIIEQFMIAANNNIALLFEDKINYLNYRVHFDPILSSLNNSIEQVKKLKINYDNEKDFYTPDNLTNIISNLSDDDVGLVAKSLILRTFKKAYYSTDNSQHYGLGFSNNYLHFTSPIRRSSDLLVHTAIDLYHGKCTDEYLAQFKKLLPEYVKTASEKEVASEKVETASNNLRTFEYLMNNNVNNIEMVVSNITEECITVQSKGFPTGYITYDSFPSNVKVNHRRKTVYIPKTNTYIKVFDKIILSPKCLNEIGIIYNYVDFNKEKKDNFRNNTRYRHK